MRHQYPNPEAVQYARTWPPTFPCQQTMPAFGRMYPMHGHGAWLNMHGDGNTDVEAGHFHRVKGFKVLPDESDGHVHEMTNLPCTAGAAHPTGRNGPIVNEGPAMMAAPPIQIMGAPPGIPTWVKVVGTLAVVGVVIGTAVYLMRRES